MEHYIAQWGYLAVLAGTFFEGETILVLAGFAACQGFLHLDGVMAAAFAGSFAGDQLWFWVGRRYGKTWMMKHPKSADAAQRVGRLLDRWGNWFVLSFRFLYGLRAVSPVAIGLSSIPARRFAVLNLISAAFWAVTVGALGYVAGDAVEGVMGRLKQWEHRIWAVMAIVAVLFVVHRLVRAKLRKPPPGEGQA